MPLDYKDNLKKSSESLPESFNLFEELKYEPKHKDQGELGSCTAFSNAALLEFEEWKLTGNYTEISRLFIYKVSRNLLCETGDTGATIKSSMAVHLLFGHLPEKYWPYTDKKGSNPDGFDREPSAFCYALAKSNKSQNDIDVFI